ncbi:MAG: hypothetical protein QG650_1130 [Patescibacteria group bacterium]|nr:hypothetical protein [Patescibacteria group bacterium]
MWVTIQSLIVETISSTPVSGRRNSTVSAESRTGLAYMVGMIRECGLPRIPDEGFEFGESGLEEGVFFFKRLDFLFQSRCFSRNGLHSGERYAGFVDEGDGFIGFPQAEGRSEIFRVRADVFDSSPFRSVVPFFYRKTVDFFENFLKIQSFVVFLRGLARGSL